MTLERLDGGRVKGSLLSAHLDCARDYRSRREFIKFVEQIPETLRRELGVLVPAGWYPFASLIELDRLIIDRFGSGDLRFADELGKYTAQRACAPIARYYDGPHAFFSHAPLLHRDWYDFLSSEYVATGERSGMMLHRARGAYSRIDCAAMSGFYSECIRLTGGHSTDVRESVCRCGGGSDCLFELRWE